jgi:hypothetical protein
MHNYFVYIVEHNIVLTFNFIAIEVCNLEFHRILYGYWFFHEIYIIMFMYIWGIFLWLLS